MSAVEQEIIEKVRKLDEDAQKHVLALIEEDFDDEYDARDYSLRLRRSRPAKGVKNLQPGSQ